VAMQQQLKKLHSNLEEAAPSFASYPSTQGAPHAQLATVRDDAMKQSQALADVIREAPRFGPAIEPRFNFRGPDRPASWFPESNPGRSRHSNIGSVAHQAPGLDNFTRLTGHGNRMPHRKGGKLHSAVGP
jgi:hypothetical protein